MTPEQAATLRQPYRWGELRHPELMNYAFMVFLDDVRFEYGWPMIVTSDARTLEENAAASGSSRTSRHLIGQAVDIEFPATAQQLWYLVEAIMKCRRAFPVELELVHGPQDQHVHIAWLKPGQASSLEVALT